MLLAGLLISPDIWSNPVKEGTFLLPKGGGTAMTSPQITPSRSQEGSDIFFILDCSGSMKKTDPQDFRKPATELMVSLLGAKDRIGIIRFGDTAETLIPLTENRTENRTSFSKAIQNISSRDLTTDLFSAVLKGFEEIKNSQRENRILVVMSDGKMDLGSPEKDEGALKKLSDLLPELVKNKIKLYTVAFTDLSDQMLLAQLAERTGGIFGMAKTDKDLHIIFSTIFEQIKAPDTVPLEGDTFYVDKDIREATILITKQSEITTRLVDPRGGEVLYGKANVNVDWYQTKAFDLITLKKPLPGRWKVQLSSKEGNKIFILTDLALKSSLRQNQVNQGQNQVIDAWLERNEHRVVEKRILESLFVIAEIKEPAGTQVRINLYPRENEGNSEKAGIFSNQYHFKNPGAYIIKITVDGKTFKRELVHQIMALAPQGGGAASTHPGQGQKSAQDPPKGAWTKALIQLGLVNMTGLLVWGLVYGGRWWIRKGKKKDPESIPES